MIEATAMTAIRTTFGVMWNPDWGAPTGWLDTGVLSPPARSDAATRPRSRGAMAVVSSWQSSSVAALTRPAADATRRRHGRTR